MVCPAAHPALLTHAVSRYTRYIPLSPLPALRRALEADGVAGVLAVDELMVLHLEELWQSAEPGSLLRQRIEAALGTPDVRAAARSRMALLAAAANAGVPTPRTLILPTAADAVAALAELGSPIVIKSDGSSGGRGVRVVETLAQATHAWHALHGPPGLIRALKRGLVEKEWEHLRHFAVRDTRDVTAQPFLSGPERTAMAVCRQGQVLACVCLEVVCTWCVRGPSSVLRVVRDLPMEDAITKLVHSLGLSGICGFDFMKATADGPSLLIEMNPRPTQLVHLPLGPGRDLVAAYLRGVLGLDGIADRPAVTDGDLIALFPQELQRDPHSDMLSQAFHDVPWGEPALMQRALGAGHPLPVKPGS